MSESDSEFDKQSVATARAAVLFIGGFMVVALVLGIVNGTIHLNMFEHPTPSWNDPITIP